jgi:hypothetical protein
MLVKRQKKKRPESTTEDHELYLSKVTPAAALARMTKENEDLRAENERLKKLLGNKAPDSTAQFCVPVFQPQALGITHPPNAEDGPAADEHLLLEKETRLRAGERRLLKTPLERLANEVRARIKGEREINQLLSKNSSPLPRGRKPDPAYDKAVYRAKFAELRGKRLPLSVHVKEVLKDDKSTDESKRDKLKKALRRRR